MQHWLRAVALLCVFPAATSGAQTRPPVSQRSTGVPADRPFDLRLLPQQAFGAHSSFEDGMLTEQTLSAHALFGIGLVRMHGRKKDGSDMRAGSQPVTRRNPAVTFVLSF